MESKRQPEKIADRYTVIDTIGSGGVGTVFKAIDPLLNKEVAVKVLQHNSDGTTAARLQREAMAAGKLNHPHICRIDNFGQTADGSPYMVMEYLEGSDLSSKIKSTGALDIADALEVARQVCGALSYAHNNGVVHRDLKPANVLLLNTGSDTIFTKLLDFGVASLESRKGDLTEAGAIIGSPLYMSPEQIRGEEVSPSSDLYSFGCMLFEMLTGMPPFKGASIVETFSLHKSADPPSLSDYGDFPAELVSLITHCLCKNAEDRPKNASEILTRIEKIQQDLLNPVVPIAPEHDEDAELREKRKKRTIMISSVFVGVLAFVGLGLIVKDIYTRQKVPVTLPSGPCAFAGMAEVYFDDDRDPNDTFQLDRDQSHGLALRAIPTVKDEEMKVLKGRKLARLCMDGATISGSGFKYLLDEPIEVLSLELTRFTDENTHYLAKLKKLRSLSLYSNALTDAAIPPISDVSKLTSLEFGSDNITNNGIAKFKNMDRINYLRLHGNKLTPDCLKRLKMRSLHTLTLDRMPITGDLSSALNAFPNLKILCIQEAPVLDIESIKSLAETNVVHLCFYSMKISDQQFKEIVSEKKLSRLLFSNVQFEGENFSLLSEMPNLGVLEFLNLKKVSNKMIEDICKNKRITDLEFVRCNFTKENLNQFLKHQNLRYINLNDCFLLDQKDIDAFKAQYKSMWGRDVQVSY